MPRVFNLNLPWIRLRLAAVLGRRSCYRAAAAAAAVAFVGLAEQFRRGIGGIAAGR